MQIPGRRQAGPLSLALALAAAFVPTRASCQGHIALIVDSAGRAIYVNAEAPESGAAKPSGAKPFAAKPFAWSGATPFLPALPASTDLRDLAGKTARSLQVDPRLVDAVIQVESGYNARARSPKGALGLMQLIPPTASRFGVSNPFDPADNLRGGVSYLGHLLTRFGGNVPMSLAAYNAGEGAVLKEGGIPPFPETREYVRKVAAAYAPAANSRNSLAQGRWDSTAPSSGGSNPASSPPIYRFVDEHGVTHFAQ